MTEKFFGGAASLESCQARPVGVEGNPVYTFHARVTDRWRNKRGLPAGDAAHWMPPLDRLDARFVCLNRSSADNRVLTLKCEDPEIMAWVKRKGIGPAVVRPDRFIADRIDARRKDLAVLNILAQAPRKVAPHKAA